MTKKRSMKTRGRSTSGTRPPGLPASQKRGSTPVQERKLSEIIKEMAERLLVDPTSYPSDEAAQVALILASAAWNSAVAGAVLKDQYDPAVRQIDWGDVVPWTELRSSDADRLVAELIEYKRETYPADRRRILSTGMTPGGAVQVQWVEPDNVVTTRFGTTQDLPRRGDADGRGRPIADKLIRRMKKQTRKKVVDLGSILAGRASAEALQRTVASREDLAELHPAHAMYVYTQNQVSVMSEQLTALKEMAPFARVIGKAEEMYMPSGPPWSPLTASFFTCWAFFDVCAGPAGETIATTVMALGETFGAHEDLVRWIGLMQASRMGLYAHEGADRSTVALRELVTGARCRAIVPSGYRGRKGELWYARVLPPPMPGGEEHVVFTTPYVLRAPGESEWLAYFRRVLPDAPAGARTGEYERHMKFGPSHDYWTEFVFEAYVNHHHDAIFLAGLPDVPESRPHSRINSR